MKNKKYKIERMNFDELKRFRVTPVMDIEDTLTGQVYELNLQNRNVICDLLNDLDQRANSNIEKVDSFLEKYYFLLQYEDFANYIFALQEIATENLKENIEYRKVLHKYGIKDVHNLDLFLFWRRGM